MIQVRLSQEQKSKNMYLQFQKDYLNFLQSLLPQSFLKPERNPKLNENCRESHSYTDLSFFNSKSSKSFNKSSPKISKNNLLSSQNRKGSSPLGQFILKIVKKIASQKYVEQSGSLESILKQLGVDIKQLNKFDGEQAKIQYMLSSIDKAIQEQKKKVMYGSKSLSHTNNINPAQNHAQTKPCSFTAALPNSTDAKYNNYMSNSEIPERIPSKYEAFIKEQNKKQADDFAWLQIKTKYPLLQKKLKSKLIQSINEDKNEKRIRQLIIKKQNNMKNKSSSKLKQILRNNSSFLANQGNSTPNFTSSASSSLGFIGKFSTNNQQLGNIDEEKIDLINESLFMQEFQKAKIDYVWTDNDENMFSKNIKQLKKKCSNKGQFLKLCGRFKFISQGEFQTLASEQISKMLNKNNKIYLSRQFLLDKYFSTTEILTQQQMRFILKTSPMLSKCVDRNFIKTAIKNIKYQNISYLQLKIAEDIIGRFQKLRSSVRISRKNYKKQENLMTKQRIAFFQKNKELQIARQIARQQLKNHKVHLIRSLNYENRGPMSAVKNKGLSKKNTKNIWTPLNKFHPSTGLFVKDCNQQCTDDLFNSYQKQYLKKIQQTKVVPVKNLNNQAQMIKFYTGGPQQNVSTGFNAYLEDVQNICAMIKAFYFQKKIVAALQSIQITCPDQQATRRQDNKTTTVELKTKKTLAPSIEQDFQLLAKKKLLQNRQKAKQTVYVSKLLFLAAQNAFQSLRALNPDFTSDQVNTKDKKGNTALYYACKFNNDQFIEYLMKFGANPNIKCEREFAPMHLGFKSNNLSSIFKLLTSALHPPNLNLLNSEFKTPLAYCSRQTLKRLNLQQGISSVDANCPILSFDNNSLLQKEEFDKIKEDSLKVAGQFANKNNGAKYSNKRTPTLTSIQNMNVQ